MNAVTTVTVPAKRGHPAKYVVAGVAGLHRQEFTDRADARTYAARLAYGRAGDYALAA